MTGKLIYGGRTSFTARAVISELPETDNSGPSDVVRIRIPITDPESVIRLTVNQAAKAKALGIVPNFL